MIKLGSAARNLRERLGLSQRAAAAQLGMSHVHLNNIENEKVSPTANIIEKYYEAWGIDLYMYAVAKYSDPDAQKPSVCGRIPRRDLEC
jgi:transcriptional regulator with XRE-family HTH domain